MKQITGKQIVEAIERNCGSDLKKMEQRRGPLVLGIPRKAVMFMAVMAAERRFDLFSDDIKEAFRNRSWMAKQASKRIEITRNRNEVRAFQGVAEHLDTKVESLREHSKNLGEFLRKSGRKDHDQAIALLVSGVLRYRTQFDSWTALAHVIREAYIAVGREDESDQITGDKLGKMAKLYRDGLPKEK